MFVRITKRWACFGFNLKFYGSFGSVAARNSVQARFHLDVHEWISVRFRSTGFYSGMQLRLRHVHYGRLHAGGALPSCWRLLARPRRCLRNQRDDSLLGA